MFWLIFAVALLSFLAGIFVASYFHANVFERIEELRTDIAELSAAIRSKL